MAHLDAVSWRAVRGLVVVVAVVMATTASGVAAPAGAARAAPLFQAPLDPFGEYTAVTPARILDTRDGTGQGGVVAPLLGGEVREVPVAGRGGLPAGGITAVVMNVTVTGPTAGGWLRVWPADEDEPTVSNLNFDAGQTVPNLVTVALSAGGTVSATVLAGRVDVIFDVVGSYADSDGQAGSRFHGITPARLLDTRGGPPLQPGETRPLAVVGAGGVPAQGVTAVALNLTVTEPTAGSYLTAWPLDVARPLASNLNFVAGQTVPNMAVVRVPADGLIGFFNLAGRTHLVVDVVGYYDQDRTTEAGRFAPWVPWRAYDSREDPTGPVPADSWVRLSMLDDDGSPAEWIGAFVYNVTVTGPTAGGYLTVYPADAPRPVASNLNFVAGQTVPNMVMVGASGPNQVGAPEAAAVFYNAFGDTNVIIDLFGVFLSGRWDGASTSSAAAAEVVG